MGRTEADRKITSEPKSSSSRRKTTQEGEEKTLLSEGRSLLKKCLTGPTLLEMSGNPTNQASGITFEFPVVRPESTPSTEITSYKPTYRDEYAPVGKIS
jgi:hypothetical protein